jgi:hypothetical protein
MATKEIYKQLPMLPVYRSGGSDYATLQEAALSLGIVQANPEHSLIRRPGVKQNMQRYARRANRIIAGTYDRSTLLKDVRAAIRVPHPEIAKLFSRQSGKQEVDNIEAHADRMLATLIKHVRRSWNPLARHIVMHSSGFDTRLLTGVLRKVASEEGNNWLGEVKFVCFQPEIQDARKIFNHVGWPAATWHPIDPGRPGEDYYAPCFDFKTIGAHLSESERFWGGPFLTQLRLGRYLTDARDAGRPLQVLSALFSDETCKWNRLKWGNVAWFLGCYWFDNPGIMPGVPEATSILPFVNDEWLNLMSTYYLPMMIDQFKLLMIKRLDPALADITRFPNWRFSAKKMRDRNVAKEAMRRNLPPEQIKPFIDQQAISQATAEKMDSDYRSSWYACEIGPPALRYREDRTFVYWSDQNTHYMKAAFYQHLIDNGVKVSL